MSGLPAAPSGADLPPKPPSPIEDSGGEKSPPRKRPRTRAPPPAATSHATPPVTSPPAATSSSTAPPVSQCTPAEPPGEIHRFPIEPLSRFGGASASVKRPREVAHFSYDDNHEYKADESGISYYVHPPLGVDMKEGFETFKHYEDKTDPHLDSLLKAVIGKEKSEGKKIHADFVTWRGMMTKIMTTPFDRYGEFSMFATLHDGTIYIEEDFPTRVASRAADAARQRQRQPTYHPDQQSHQMMTYWGYKFETLALIPTPPFSTSPAQIEAYQRSVTSNAVQHCSIVKTAFGPHSMILAGEVDGLLAPKPSRNPDAAADAPTPWVELKTAEELPPPHRQQHRDILRFERKLLKFWAQSFLLGVPNIIVGFRTRGGVLTSTQRFDTAALPGMVRRGTACWDGNVCVNFTASVLGWLKEIVTEEGAVYSLVLSKGYPVVEVRRVRGGYGGVVSEEFLRWRASGAEGEGVEKEQEKGKGKEKEKEGTETEGGEKNGDEE